MGNEPVISITNWAGDSVRFHVHNTRTTKCAECGARLEAGCGVKRHVRKAKGTGFLCHICAGAAILSFATYSNNIPNSYRYIQSSEAVASYAGGVTLAPFDGVIATYAIPALELAQAWADHGSFGLRFTADNLREQARAEFLAARNIPTTSKVNLSTSVPSLVGVPA